ncbi:MAG: phosphoribosylformylglycinamidine synthase-associated small membrane protein [Roseibium sp.]
MDDEARKAVIFMVIKAAIFILIPAAAALIAVFVLL